MLRHSEAITIQRDSDEDEQGIDEPIEVNDLSKSRRAQTTRPTPESPTPTSPKSTNSARTGGMFSDFIEANNHMYAS